jgi:hypothetical protein
MTFLNCKNLNVDICISLFGTWKLKVSFSNGYNVIDLSTDF